MERGKLKHMYHTLNLFCLVGLKLPFFAPSNQEKFTYASSVGIFSEKSTMLNKTKEKRAAWFREDVMLLGWGVT